MSTRGIRMIGDERQRQIDAEGWTPEHDAQHHDGELVQAALSYLEHTLQDENAEVDWPWEPESWNPGPGGIRTLVKAGALIAAEIDRLVRPCAAGEVSDCSHLPTCGSEADKAMYPAWLRELGAITERAEDDLDRPADGVLHDLIRDLKEFVEANEPPLVADDV